MPSDLGAEFDQALAAALDANIALAQVLLRSGKTLNVVRQELTEAIVQFGPGAYGVEPLAETFAAAVMRMAQQGQVPHLQQ